MPPYIEHLSMGCLFFWVEISSDVFFYLDLSGKSFRIWSTKLADFRCCDLPSLQMDGWFRDDPILSFWVTYFQGRTVSFREGIHHGLLLCSWFFMILPQKCSSAQRRGRRTWCTSLTQTSLVGKSGELNVGWWNIHETWWFQQIHQINDIYIYIYVQYVYKYPIIIIFYDGLVQAVLLCQ